jgi:hypothetical protein
MGQTRQAATRLSLRQKEGLDLDAQAAQPAGMSSSQPPAADRAGPGSPPPDWAAARARAYAVCSLCITTAAVFFLTGVTPLPVLLYFPLSRRFAFQLSRGGGPAELSMDFYGRALLALLSGVAVALPCYVALRLQGRRRQPRTTPAGDGSTLLLFTAYAATALLLAVGLYAYQLAVRVPSPEPLPVAQPTVP